jgi:hypothetical protein
LEGNGLKGPFVLTDDVIDQQVSHRSPGAFALDTGGNGGDFNANFVGRSDMDLNSQLHVYVGRYARFKFVYCPSGRAAFEAECRLFHNFAPEGNPVHPVRPPGYDWVCPLCTSLG